MTRIEAFESILIVLNEIGRPVLPYTLPSDLFCCIPDDTSNRRDCAVRKTINMINQNLLLLYTKTLAVLRGGGPLGGGFALMAF